MLFSITWVCFELGLLKPEIINQYHEINPKLAVFLFGIIYVLVVISSLPSLPLNLAAGFFWGGLIGGVYSSFAVTIGGYITFSLARALVGRPLAKQFKSEWAQLVQEEIQTKDWRFVAFMRLNPIIPTGPLNYLLGLTSMSQRVFLLTTFIFLLPPSIAVAYIGDTLQTFTSDQFEVTRIIQGALIVSASVTFLAFIKFIFSIRKKEKNKI
jgi:uncharacterized membrane protein YdjX (TVP38/TMEM64 family)